MAAWPRCHKKAVINMALKQSGLNEDLRQSIAELLKRNLRKDMTITSTLCNHKCTTGFGRDQVQSSTGAMV